MKPEPWGEALDALGTDGDDRRRSPRRRASRSPRRSPASWRAASTWSSPAAATRASTSGCSTTPRPAATVREISLGDYVLNGGEVAALAITEAVVRLLPGLHGQRRVAGRGVARGRAAGVPRLHQARLLARPRRARRCCCPATTRAIAAWRHEQAVRRTAERRPDLAGAQRRRRRAGRRRRPARGARRRRRALHPAAGLLGRRSCEANPGVEIPALHESLDDVRRGLGDVDRPGRSRPRRAGWSAPSAAGSTSDGEWDIGRLMVAPDLQGRGLGRALLARIEDGGARRT